MAENYQVLARKYRPGTFAELLGQDALVRTLQNSIKLGKVAHAFMLTGVRGVGKTTTARIIAKALNCQSSKDDNPVEDPCNQCESCKAIDQDRHLDVLELDAASQTSVDNIRGLTEKAGYKPAIGRTKVYILDEVHMLSNKAFPALLKTLEEPPPQVVFILATTDIEKVPVTILSRCQRFDLARVKMGVLENHFKNICKAEKISVDDEALHLLSLNAEGSVRDGLSLLEQAAAIGGGTISADTVREMLGLADREILLDLFDLIIKADAAAMLAKVAELDNLGVDALQIIKELLDLDYRMTRMKLAPDSANDGLSELQKERCEAMAETLSLMALSRIWQVLFRGFNEVKIADNRRQALEMVLIRLLYLSATPTPEEMLRGLQEGGTPTPTATPTPTPTSTPTSTPIGTPVTATEATPKPSPSPESSPAPSPAVVDSPVIDSSGLEKIKDIVAEKDPQLASLIYSGMHLVSLDGNKVAIRLRTGLASDLLVKMRKILNEYDGGNWEITESTDSGLPTLAEQKKQQEEQMLENANNDSMVLQIKNHFPKTSVEDIKIH